MHSRCCTKLLRQNVLNTTLYLSDAFKFAWLNGLLGCTFTGGFPLLFYWNLVNLQCCITLKCSAKWFSYIYIKYIYYFPSWFIHHRILNILWILENSIIEYWLLCPVLYSRTLLFSQFLLGLTFQDTGYFNSILSQVSCYWRNPGPSPDPGVGCSELLVVCNH